MSYLHIFKVYIVHSLISGTNVNIFLAVSCTFLFTKIFGSKNNTFVPASLLLIKISLVGKCLLSAYNLNRPKTFYKGIHVNYVLD